MTEGEIKKRHRRGASPRGEFEAAKSFATARKMLGSRLISARWKCCEWRG